jgi:CMP-N-acetylneuraminic acid synthetase/spore coat polysaccharide biosynthesis predicted glycosyltransferase SpsG
MDVVELPITQSAVQHRHGSQDTATPGRDRRRAATGPTYPVARVADRDCRVTNGSPPGVLVVIPARGGSKGIPRKNLRSLHGRPLIAYAIETALRSSYRPTVLLTSDDDEILSVGEALGAVAYRRPAALAGDAVTLDGVVHDAYVAALARSTTPIDVVVTMQPTSPLLTTTTLDRAIEQLWSRPDLDTVLSATDDRHLRWVEQDGTLAPAYEARVNRQQLPATYRETGGIFASRASVLTPSDRIGRRVDVVLVEGPEAIDIDGPDDWALCEWHLGRKDVLFVVIGDPTVGLGHAYNALAVAGTLTRHRIRFLVERGSELARSTIASRNYEVAVQAHDRLEDDIDELGPDLVINDILDTSAAYVDALKRQGRTVVNFEDLGPGATRADLVINAIYPERDALPDHYFGPRYYCPRPEFLVGAPVPTRPQVGQVLVTFGGVDPNNLTRRVVRVAAPIARRHGALLTVILGLGYGHDVRDLEVDGVEVHRSVSNMARRMREADVVFTSAGRTTFEVACVGTPAIVIAQNERELSHLFATEGNGFLHLGLATDVDDDAIAAALELLIGDEARRREMQRRLTATNLTDGLERVRLLIEGLTTR